LARLHASLLGVDNSTSPSRSRSDRPGGTQSCQAHAAPHEIAHDPDLLAALEAERISSTDLREDDLIERGLLYREAFID